MGSNQSRNVTIPDIENNSNEDKKEVDIPVTVVIDSEMNFNVQYCKHIHTSGRYRGYQCNNKISPGFPLCQVCMCTVSEMECFRYGI